MLPELIAALLVLAASDPAGFAIAGQAIPQAQILDARALPDLGGGGAAVMITFTPEAAGAVERITATRVGQAVPITLDGTLIARPVVREAISGGVLEISGQPDLAAAATLAKRISGKDPLPEDLAE